MAGAEGSYLFSPSNQDTFTRVPAVELDDVADPTGAGNAYAGALCAGVAAGVPVADAAATASAVGAAFCRAADWAPSEGQATRSWLERAAADVRVRTETYRAPKG